MSHSSEASQLVDAVISDFPDHAPGTRPVHTIGVGVQGYFTASDVACTYCVARHFQAEPVAATVRFSNGSGSPVRHDGWSDVRGMATRFHLGDDTATDLIAMTLGEFFSADVAAFLAFTKAAQPAPVQRQSPWRKIRDMLQLKPPLPGPMPGQHGDLGAAGMLNYANRHAAAQLAVFQAGMIGAPVSYARASYHAVHSFVVIDACGVRRHVRFSWQPVAGVRTTDPAIPPCDDYLRQELEQRLKRWPARFMLMMTIGEAGDAFDDPTRPWPDKRIRVVMGTLTLQRLAPDQTADCERLSFNPCRLTPGIEVSDDPILRARRDAYEVSRQMRGGVGCPFTGSHAGAT